MISPLTLVTDSAALSVRQGAVRPQFWLALVSAPLAETNVFTAAASAHSPASAPRRREHNGAKTRLHRSLQDGRFLEKRNQSRKDCVTGPSPLP